MESWIAAQTEDSSLRQNLMSDEDMHRQSEELLGLFIKAIQTNNFMNTEAREFNDIIDLLKNISSLRAHTGFSPRETVNFVFSLKRTISRILQDEPDVPTEDVSEISNLLDNLGIVTVEAFIGGREEVIARQSDEINEIFTPVIKVWDGVLALPIIGTIDSASILLFHSTKRSKKAIFM